MIEIKLPVYRECMSIVTHSNKVRKASINLAGITEEQELALDNKQSIELRKDGIIYTVNYKDVYCYGEIDFSNSSTDLDEFCDFEWQFENTKPCYLPAYYNYDKHCAYAKTIKSAPIYTETFDNATIAQWVHGCIGKPKRCVIFLDKHGKHRTY